MTPSTMDCNAGAACDFMRDYQIAQAPVMLDIERLVRGADYGATSWMTLAQAEQTLQRLALAPGLRLLDLGAGSGWPALWLAQRSGCDAVLADLPLSGLRIARSRAARDGLQSRCAVLAGDAAALPLPAGSFDRIHHADVLCCLEPKRETLRECRRVARPSARMEFSVIRLTRGPTSADERALLQQSGPPWPDAGADYAELLDQAGWHLALRINVTAEFARCIDIAIEQSRLRRDDLLALLGEQDYAERMVRRRSTRAAVECGLLEREIIVAQC